MALAGPWFLRAESDHTTAIHLVTSKKLRLEGALHTYVWAGGDGLRAFRSFDEDFAVLADAIAAGTEEPTLEALLRGPSGWGVFFLELTGRCNESCLHCYAKSSPSVDRALPLQTIEQAIRDARRLGFQCIQLIGGDPLLSPHLPRAIEICSELATPKIEVFTNGLALNEGLLHLFEEHGVHLAFSMYSHHHEVHDAVTRTPGSHQRTSRAIRRALDRHLIVRVVGVEGCASGQDEKSLRSYLAELGVAAENVWVDRQRPVGRGQWNDDVDLLTDVQVSRHADKGFPGCGKLCITYSGQVVPCIFDRETVFGSIHNTRLISILRQAVIPGNRKVRPGVLGEPLACGDCRNRRHLLGDLAWG